MSDSIRPCGAEDRPAILEIINAAAEAYRGAIPADCWHEPYMNAAELEAEIARGVAFAGSKRKAGSRQSWASSRRATRP